MSRSDLPLLCFCACTVLAASVLLEKTAPALSPAPQGVGCRVEVGPLEPLFLSPGRLEPELSLPSGQIQGATVTELPSPASGWLFFNNRPVALYQQLTREEVEQLVFVPHEAYETARVALILQCPESPYAVVQIATGKTGSFAENPA